MLAQGHEGKWDSSLAIHSQSLWTGIKSNGEAFEEGFE